MIKIRSADTDDQHQLFNLVASIDTFNVEDRELAREVIYDGLPSGRNGYHILVALENEKSICGFICYGEIPLAAGRWDLYWVAVAPKSSRQGVGSLLMQGMEENLEPGMRIYIDTSSTSGFIRAHSFYEQLGYEVVCVLPDFYGPGDDKIVYYKEL